MFAVVCNCRVCLSVHATLSLSVSLTFPLTNVSVGLSILAAGKTRRTPKVFELFQVGVSVHICVTCSPASATVAVPCLVCPSHCRISSFTFCRLASSVLPLCPLTVSRPSPGESVLSHQIIDIARKRQLPGKSTFISQRNSRQFGCLFLRELA